jgi:hypothetical protein
MHKYQQEKLASEPEILYQKYIQLNLYYINLLIMERWSGEACITNLQ